MNITESEIHGLPLLALEGELDHSAKQEVREVVESIIHGAYPPRSLIIDMTDCTYIDSAGLGVLFSALRGLPPDGWLGLVGVAPEIKRVLTYAGLLDVERVRFFSSLNDASASLGREPLMSIEAEAEAREYEREPDVWQRWEHGDPL